MQIFNSNQDLITAYLNGSPEGAFETVRFKDGDFYAGKALLAKRTKDGEVLLGASRDISDDINDAFLISIAKTGTKYNRIGDFNNLLAASTRLKELRSGQYDNLRMIGNLFGKFELTDEETKLYADKETIEGRIKAVEDRVVEYFSTKQQEQALKQKEAELAAMDEAKRSAVINWDNGTSNETRHVHGSGGGYRLRQKEYRGKPSVESTSGHTTTINMLKQGFNKLAPYIFGDKMKEYGDTSYMGRTYNSGNLVSIGYVRSHNMQLSKTDVRMGCQQVRIEELRRFAATLGWPLDGSPVPA